MIPPSAPALRGKMTLMGALYRKVRPATFDAVVGQEHVKEILQNAIAGDRLAHAYLFSGPRGVGKTTTARLLAMSVGCQAQPGQRPCGECENCRLVREDRHPDVVEIDAASNNSVDDVRELRERILLAPLLAPKKVIILDEAHMMSKSAFNALLKTLEEPPQHVIFIFATTEPERMPATILSRTQHFRFRRLSEEEIVGKLARIIEQEKRRAEPAALALIARMSGGAMRDAESILDRLLALDADPITHRAAEEALGLPPAERVERIAAALDEGSLEEALGAVKELFSEGYAARTLTERVAAALQSGLYASLKLGEGLELKSPPQRVIAALSALDEHLDKLVKREDPFTLELGLLKAYEALHGKAAEQPRQTPPPVAPKAAAPKAAARPQPAETPPAETDKNQAAAAKEPSSQKQSAPPPRQIDEVWRLILNDAGVRLRAFLLEARPHLEEDALVLVYDEEHRFHHDRALSSQEAIAAAVQQHLQLPLRFQIVKKNSRIAPEARQKPAEEKAPPPPAAAGQGQEAPPEAAPKPEAAPQPRRAAPARSKQRRKKSGKKSNGRAAPRFEKIEMMDDPRLQKIQQLFQAQLRQVWREQPPEEESGEIED